MSAEDPTVITTIKSGYWYTKGEQFSLYHFKDDKWNTKNIVCLDCPGVRDFMSGSLKFGDFGPAHADIVEATGVQNYNLSLEAPMMTRNGVLNSSGDQIHIWSMFGKMDVINLLNDEDLEKLKEDREPVEAPIVGDYFTPKPDQLGKLLWFSGPPGAGKSTAASIMGRKHGYVYYEADCFGMFVNPFIDPNVEEPSLALAVQKPLKGMDEETIMAIDKAAEVEQILLTGEMHKIEGLLEPMYKMMAKDLIRQRLRLGGDMAIAQAVFTRDQRDMLRNLIGPDLIFIVISMSKECTAARIKKRHGDNIGDFADAFIKFAELCEKAGDDEENAFNVIVTEDMSIDDVMNKVLEIVQKL